MGKIEKNIRIPTDAYVRVRMSQYFDLEDGDMDGWSGMALRAAADSDEDELQEALGDDFDSSEADASDMDIEIAWNYRFVMVCEWCESPTCSGEPDECDSAPEEEDTPVVEISEEAHKMAQKILIDAILKDAPEGEAIL